MLKIIVPGLDLWDEAKEEFVSTKEYEFTIEHSLVSLSKWEAKWCKPFLLKGDKTREETLDYIRCMTISQNANTIDYNLLPQTVIDTIREYIDAPMTATTINRKDNKGTNKEIITSEIIYYWMVTFQIPFECQKWHLNRLIKLIEVCNIKNQPKQKINSKEAAAKRRSLNAERRAKNNTKG